MGRRNRNVRNHAQESPDLPNAKVAKNQSTTHADPVRYSRWDVLLLALLVGMVVAVFWRLALTNLIIGRGDLFFYFYPYRDYASEAARAGRVPLWNPYSFMGAPFLANSQVGFFYPLNLALAWLPVERMVNAGIVVHAALAACGAYLWGRSRLGLRRSGAWLAGLGYGLGGYLVAQTEHLNQVQVLAWMPWLLLLYRLQFPAGVSAARQAAQTGMQIVGLGLIIALQFFAGHLQSVFICLVGLASYALLPVVWEVLRRRAKWCGLLRPLAVVVGASLLGAALAAIQLLPTLELSSLSIRSGGLPYKEAVSFSLRPELVGRALLPSWGPPLFPEFIAYVGVVGLGLAAVGILADWWGIRATDTLAQRDTPAFARTRSVYLARRGALVLTALGLFLALGGFNPVYVLLVKLVPGFGLFRAPARWLALYAVGIAGLIGIGLDTAVMLAEASPDRPAQRWRALWFAGICGVGAVSAWALLGVQLSSGGTADLSPALGYESLIGWLAAVLVLGALMVLGLRIFGMRAGRAIAVLSACLVTVELLGASTVLPINRATAPDALTSLRPAVTHLLGEANASTPGPAARFLSISDILFDPGDLSEIRIIFEPQLSADAFYDYIIATKQKEVLIPNLPLYYRLPAMDGYDGGVLPLRRYVTLESLYMPEDDVAIDGRLRENLEAVPDGRWLSLFNVRYVITDKVRDAWFDDVFYDMQMGATLRDGEEAAVGYVPSGPATAVGVVYQADGSAEDTLLAYVDVTFADGRSLSLPLLADAAGTGERVARLTWGRPEIPKAVNVRGAWGRNPVTIRGLSLIDERTDVFLPLILSDSGSYRLVHSGDVKIYENLETFPRLFFVPNAVTVPDDEAALGVMRDPDFDPANTVVLVAGEPGNAKIRIPDSDAGTTNHADVEFLLYDPERIVATVSTPTDGWLLLTDAWYPGWEVRVDGEPVQVNRADILFRAVAVGTGEHQVEWVFRPASFHLGVVISLFALGLLMAVTAGIALSRKKRH
jgi:hypothetical protein